MRMEAGVKSHKLLLIKILTAFFIGLAVLSCQNEKPIIIGFVGGTSGRAADLGISGRQIRLIIKDDQQNPAIARPVVSELIVGVPKPLSVR